MSKVLLVLVFSYLVLVPLSFAADDSDTSLRPLQKIMRARFAWVGSMSKSLESQDYTNVAKDADALSAQTAEVGKGLQNPLAKDITLAVSTLADELSKAAQAGNKTAAAEKLDAIKGKCNECHAKIRDVKR